MEIEEVGSDEVSEETVQGRTVVPYAPEDALPESVRLSVYVTMPRQVMVQGLQTIAGQTASAIQQAAEQSAQQVATLTRETGTTFSRVEEVVGEIDTRLESMGENLEILQRERAHESERARETLRPTKALERQMAEAESQRKLQLDEATRATETLEKRSQETEIR